MLYSNNVVAIEPMIRMVSKLTIIIMQRVFQELCNNELPASLRYMVKSPAQEPAMTAERLQNS